MVEARGNKKLKEGRKTPAKGKMGTGGGSKAYYKTTRHGCVSHIPSGNRLRGNRLRFTANPTSKPRKCNLLLEEKFPARMKSSWGLQTRA